MDRPFLVAEWRYLVMVNYEIDSEILDPLVPAGTRLDTWRDAAYVSIVAFQFRNTRLLGLSIPFHRHFEEINLRFYVRRDAADGPRPGVVFVREIVPRRALASVARWVYNEPYIALPTYSVIQPPASDGPGRFEYAWRLPSRWCRLAASVHGEPSLPGAGSLEEFISEHHWGYNRQPDGTSLEYRVEHRRWGVWRATGVTFDCDCDTLYGPVFAPILSAAPRSVFVADGSPVMVYRGRRVACP